jgi:LacI family transcriptional regulator
MSRKKVLKLRKTGIMKESRFCEINLMKKVALLVETSHGYGRQLLAGVAKYSRLHGPWSFYITPKDFHQELPKMRQWRGDGIIARTTEDLSIVRDIIRSGLPAIMLDPPKGCRIPQSSKRRIICVSPDVEKIAQLSADYFLNQGFRRFAFCGVADQLGSESRQMSFVNYLQKQGYDCSIYKPKNLKNAVNWEIEQADVSTWLQSLMKPVAIMTCNDVRGRQVLDACGVAGVAVPKEAAVLGVDDDEVFCELCTPTLSSIALNVEHAGFELSGLLDKMMQGKVGEQEFFDVEPLYVVERQSTEVLAVEDRVVAEALAFIRSSATKPLSVLDVANKAAVSRRSLEIRFRRAVGWSVHDEIQRIRLNRVRQLLVETDLPVEKISVLSGFAAASYMSATFRKHWGLTPLQYRQQNRA